MNKLPPIQALLNLSNATNQIFSDWVTADTLDYDHLNTPTEDFPTCPASPMEVGHTKPEHYEMSLQIEAPKRKREKPREAFTSIDDKLLLIAVAKHGCNWPAVSAEMGRFTTRQCRERYMNYLNPSLKMVGKPWTVEENSLLLHLFKINGPKWRFISNFFKGRSYNEVRNHCVRLQKNYIKIL